MSWFFVDCEADFKSPCPGLGEGMTEFGVVEYQTRQTFHGFQEKVVTDKIEYIWPLKYDVFISVPDYVYDWNDTMEAFRQWIKTFPQPWIFWSDNPAYDWQWINYYFHHTIQTNPFGHSARRIGDFYAGLVGDPMAASKWKKLRITKHDHNPVHDAMGNVEAMKRMLNGERAN